MDRLRRSFRDSFRRRKDRLPESSKPHQWQSDESAVRSATCSFPVKYMGCVEVYESRGMQVCEEALKVLRVRKEENHFISHPFLANIAFPLFQNSRRRPVRGLLHVSGDGLRVVDDETKGLIVDQTIEKVSFCAPDRNHERGFSYICRDGTTRRWMCHGFLASKDSGERLSHAVGCAFAVCLERKQRRDKECGVTMAFDAKTSTFTRNGSFRQQTITERMLANERGVDVLPPSMMVTPQAKPFNPFAIERPHATPSMLERQGSFRGLGSLGTTSPFKRQMSLRLNDLPSNAERQRAFLDLNTPKGSSMHQRSVSPIPEAPANAVESVSQLCQEMSEELTLMTAGGVGRSVVDTNMISLMQSAPTSPVQVNSTNMDRITQMSVFTNPTINGTTGTGQQGYAATFTTTTMTTTTTASIMEANSISNQLNNNNNEDKFANHNLHKSKPLPAIPCESPVNVEGDVSPLRTNGVLTMINSSQSSSNSSSRLSGASSVQELATTTSPMQRVLPMVEETAYPGAESPPKRTPMLGNTSKAKSMSAADPFDAEWAAPIAKSDVHNTNPFISPPKPPAQSFQVQL